ncbi:histidinol dehydrogenase [Denitratimonas tolerans]|uniref:Histidinol dehydrogenase n=1 Tax=Denitratimonas tolerans TaxID=1338420 RepID=A0AAW9R461_9GAMM
MNLFVSDWNALSESARSALLQRPALADDAALREAVAALIARVRDDGEAALRELTVRFDGCELEDFRVSPEAFERARREVSEPLRAAIFAAKARIERFHAAGMTAPYAMDTAPGVRCERVLRPIRRVGLYVPAGSAPLPSTALMLGVPAALAGCPEVILCTPPRADGTVDPTVLVAAEACGITRVFRLGGVQAIAAMAQGAGAVPRCDKLFGPGNGYVTEAKRQVSAAPGGPAIDMPAGPSEVLVIADAEADAEFVAADLLSQAEHGPDSQAILLSDSMALLDAVAVQIRAQAAGLPRAAILARSLDNLRLIRTRDIAQAIEISNAYAPEHLILSVREPRRWLDAVTSAGSIFLGDYAPEALGDYCSGTNHVLPTYGAARAWSGVSVASFQKAISVQEVSAEGLRAIGPDAVTLARAERLEAHAQAVSRRLARIGGAP